MKSVIVAALLDDHHLRTAIQRMAEAIIVATLLDDRCFGARRSRGDRRSGDTECGSRSQCQNEFAHYVLHVRSCEDNAACLPLVPPLVENFPERPFIASIGPRSEARCIL